MLNRRHLMLSAAAAGAALSVPAVAATSED